MIRVAVMEIEGVLRDIIIGALTQDGGLELVMYHADVEEGWVQDRRVDVVIMGVEDGELPVTATRLFAARPGIKILGVSGDGRSVSLYELQPVRKYLGEISVGELISAVKAAAPDSGGGTGMKPRRFPRRSSRHRDDRKNSV